MLTLKSSHRPDGIFTCFALVLSGWRCLHQQWHGELLIVHHHGQHSLQCACSCSKVPIAPMGFSHVLRLCLQGGGVCVDSGTVTFSSCTITGNTAYYVRAHAQKFPSPRWDFSHVLRVCLQGGGVRIDGGTVTFSSCTITGNTAVRVRAHAQKIPSPRWEDG